MQVSALRAWLLGGTAAIACAVGVVGFAHTPSGRALLAAMPGCPLGFDRSLTADGRDQGRREVNERLRGAATASPARLSLGFVLDETRADDVRRWAAAVGGQCDGTRPFDMECSLPREAARYDGTGTLPPGTVSFAFAGNGRLIRVLASERVASAAAATDRMRSEAGTLVAALGEPQEATGPLDAEYLGAAPLRQVRRVFAFHDYRADIRATHMGGLGYFTVNRTYQSLRD